MKKTGGWKGRLGEKLSLSKYVQSSSGMRYLHEDRAFKSFLPDQVTPEKVRVFHNQSNSGTSLDELIPASPLAGENVTTSTVSGDGNTIAIGASSDISGIIRIYRKVGDEFVEHSSITSGEASESKPIRRPADGFTYFSFGAEVALSNDGNTVIASVIHSSFSTITYKVFEYSGGIWTVTAAWSFVFRSSEWRELYFIPPVISGDGKTVAFVENVVYASTYRYGRIRVFSKGVAGSWSHQATLGDLVYYDYPTYLVDTGFTSLSLSRDGNTIAASAVESGVSLFSRDVRGWHRDVIPAIAPAISCVVSPDCSRYLAHYSVSSLVEYKRVAGSWVSNGAITPPMDYEITRVSDEGCSADWSTVTVEIYDPVEEVRAIAVYVRTSGVLAWQQTLFADPDQYDALIYSSISQDGRTVFAQSSNSPPYGALLVYDFDGLVWSMTARVPFGAWIGGSKVRTTRTARSDVEPLALGFVNRVLSRKLIMSKLGGSGRILSVDTGAYSFATGFTDLRRVNIAGEYSLFGNPATMMRVLNPLSVPRAQYAVNGVEWSQVFSYQFVDPTLLYAGAPRPVVSDDGSTVAIIDTIGYPGIADSRVAVFLRDGTSYALQGYLNLGVVTRGISNLAISADGNTISVFFASTTNYTNRGAFIFHRNSGVWGLEAQIPNDFYNVATPYLATLSGNGGVLVTDYGTVMRREPTGTWSVSTLPAGFGNYSIIDNSGNTVASTKGFIYEYDGFSWEQTLDVRAYDVLALSGNGDTLALRSGDAEGWSICTFFTKASGTWAQLGATVQIPPAFKLGVLANNINTQFSSDIAFLNTDGTEFYIRFNWYDWPNSGTSILRYVLSGSAWVYAGPMSEVNILNLYVSQGFQFYVDSTWSSSTDKELRVFRRSKGSNAALSISRASATGSYQLLSYPVDLRKNPKIPLSVESYPLSGKATGLRKDSILALASEAYQFTGNATKEPGLINVPTANYPLQGVDVGLLHSYPFSIAAANYSIQPSDAGLLRGRPMVVPTAAYQFSGQDVTFEYIQTLRFPLAGKDVKLKWKRIVPHATGDYDLIGYAVGSGGTDPYKINTGIYTIAGVDVALRTSFTRMPIQSGVYLVRDQNVSFVTSHKTMPVTTGRLYVFGNEVVFGGSKKIFKLPYSAHYLIQSYAVGLLLDNPKVCVPTKALSIVGRSATLTHFRPLRSVSPVSGAYSVGTNDALLNVFRRKPMACDSGELLLSGQAAQLQMARIFRIGQASYDYTSGNAIMYRRYPYDGSDQAFITTYARTATVKHLAQSAFVRTK